MKTPEEILDEVSLREIGYLPAEYEGKRWEEWVVEAMEQYAKEAIADQEAIIQKLASALSEITEGKGRYSLDKLQHASNTIEDMTELAKTALSELPETYQNKPNVDDVIKGMSPVMGTYNQPQELTEPPDGWCECINDDVSVLELITVCRHCLKQIKPQQEGGER